MMSAPELKAFLDYAAGKKPADPFVDELEEAVENARKNREWRHEYMTLSMRDQENQEIGEEKLAKLIQILSKNNQLPDIIKVTDDKEYRQKLYVEYHIT